MNSLDIHEILDHLPHRYPFLLIDRVLDYEVGAYLTAIKNVSINEPFFPGHFPIRPVMPGVLVIEAMAQATGVLSFITAKEKPSSGSLYYLAGIDKARFKHPVEPGDQLIITVKWLKTSRDVWKYESTAKVGDKLAASAELMCVRRYVAPDASAAA